MAGERLIFLDGMRGWAAVVVLLYHSYSNSYPATSFAQHHLWKFLPFNGILAVMLFFLISGYSLALPYLKTKKRRSIIKIAAGRYLRLAIPVFAACAVTHVLLVTRIILAPADRVPFDRFLNLDLTVPRLLQFSFWDVFFNYSHPIAYIPPLWTMSVELFGSLVVLGVQFLIGRSKWRWLAYLLLMAWFLWSQSYNFLFVAGLTLAELCAVRTWESPRWAGSLLIAAGVLQPFFMPVGLLPGFAGATCLFVGVLLTPVVQAGLSRRFSVYLGKLSFPLYLMHSPMMYVVGIPIVAAAKGGPLMTLLGASLAVPVAIAAGTAFIPINELAVRVSRAFGNFIASLLQRKPTPRSV